MRIKIARARSNRTAQWQEYYAWRPVRVDQEWVWLETIERRFVWYASPFDAFQETEYRIPKDSP